MANKLDENDAFIVNGMEFFYCVLRFVVDVILRIHFSRTLRISGFFFKCIFISNPCEQSLHI